MLSSLSNLTIEVYIYKPKGGTDTEVLATYSDVLEQNLRRWPKSGWNGANVSLVWICRYLLNEENSIEV